MMIFRRLASVRAAQIQATLARQGLNTPAAALLTRGRGHPLTTVGAAAGTGFVLGSLNMNPLRVPGLGALFGGGLAEAVGFGVRLIAELGVSGLGAVDRRTSRSDRPPDSAPRSAPQVAPE